MTFWKRRRKFPPQQTINMTTSRRAKDVDERHRIYPRLVRPTGVQARGPRVCISRPCEFPPFSRPNGRCRGWDVLLHPADRFKAQPGRVPAFEHGPRRQYETILYAIKGSKKANHIYPDVIPLQRRRQHGPRCGRSQSRCSRTLLQRSVKPGDKVLDSFAGSGPLLEAAAPAALLRPDRSRPRRLWLCSTRGAAHRRC